jgi:hypothetical protein
MGKEIDIERINDGQCGDDMHGWTPLPGICFGIDFVYYRSKMSSPLSVSRNVFSAISKICFFVKPHDVLSWLDIGIRDGDGGDVIQGP